MWYVFHTDWGWSAYQENDGLLQQLILPLEVSRHEFLSRHALIPTDTEILTRPVAGLAAQIQAYFSGKIILRWEANLNLRRFSPFARGILELAAAIPYGETRTYGQLAGRAGSPGAARAVGRVMASNPFPLVVPCHRVVAVNGPAGFSAPGGVTYKQALLELEQKGLAAH
ncbi:MAG: methylated-DNA--[protein]-cysteine S-methyltransferase [Syntrophomonadaceae bacterium]|jgi:methylated-DNA-[protein]-cysteine S-methyltransferase